MAVKSPKPFIAVTVWSFGRLGGDAVKRLKDAGFRIRTNTTSRTLRPEETLAMARNAVGVIAGVERWDETLFAACPRLQVISRIGVGLDSIDLKAARRHGVKIAITPEPTTQPVAELALGMMLSLLRRLPNYHEVMRKGHWQAIRAGLLSGKTLGIVGLGRIGHRLVELVAPFGVKILVSEPKPDRPFIRRHGIELVSLARLLKESDIVTLHLAYSPAVRHFMNRGCFQKMKRGAFFINTARGPLVEEKALAEALRSGRLAGAALDVFETEPYRGRLTRLPNVMATPHIASFTDESWLGMERQAVDNLLHSLV
jgi:D-3-phosphoglycerate dehydrogenase